MSDADSVKRARKLIRRYTRHAAHNAQILAASGYHVFPVGLAPDHPTPTGWKLRKIYFKGLAWSTEATADPQRAAELFAAHPDAAVGVATGPSGVVVLDDDDPDRAEPLPDIPADAFTYPTARGGRHWWTRAPKSKRIRSGALSDIDGVTYPDADRKAHGGMVIFYGTKRLDEATAPAPRDLPALPKRWRVQAGAVEVDDIERATDDDVQAWMDAETDAEPDARTLLAIETLPRDGEGDATLREHLLRVAGYAHRSARGRRRALELFESAWFDGHPDPNRNRRKFWTHDVPGVVAKIKDDPLDPPPLTPLTDFPQRPAKRRKKAKRNESSGKKRRAAELDHDEYQPRGTIDQTQYPGHPVPVALDILGQNILPPLLYWRGSWHLYDNGHWRISSAEDIENLLYAALADAVWMKHTAEGAKPMPWTPTQSRVREVLRAIQSMRTLPKDTEAPTWLHKRGKRPAMLVPARDCLLDPRTGKAHPRSQHFFSTGFVDADVAVAPRKPREWLKFLRSVWPDDPESIALLQEWLGYVVAGDVRRQKGMLMIGPARSGKGTIIHVAEALVGGSQGAYSASMSSFSGEFGLELAEGRSLLTMGDLRGSGREAATAAQKLLEIIGGDSVYINRKGRQAITAPLRTRVMIGTNSMPRLYDDAGVIESRFVLLRMHESFKGREDLGLLERLLTELDGIVHWALDGYRRLEKQGRFTAPASDAEDRRELRQNAAPITEFLEDACAPTRGLGSPRISMWNAYVSWCADTGAPAMKHEQFTPAMAGAGHPPHRPYDDTGSRVWRYRGIKLLHEESGQERAQRLWPIASIEQRGQQ